MSEVRYSHSQKVLAADVGHDFVALNVEDGQCYGMEKVTAAVWRLLAEPIGIADICASLVQQYDVSPSACREEVQELIDKMTAEGLVEAVKAEQPEA